MDDQNQTAGANDSGKAYNLNVTPVGAIDQTPTQGGKPKVKFRGSLTQRGKTVERTVVAQGKAAELIAGIVKTDETIGLRCLFERAPGTEGKRGGEFLTVVALPREREDKAA